MATNQEQIESLYQSELGRASDPGGLAYWTNALSSGASISDIQNAFRGSEEAQSRAAAPVSSGLSSLSSPSPAPTATATAAPVSSGTDQVSNYYQQYLGRAPEAEGLNYWNNAISSGQMTADQVANAIKSSSEGLAYSAPKTISDLYQTNLGRAADTEGLNYWTNALTSGQMTADQIANALRTSNEGDIYNAPKTVAELYQTNLGRAPDQAGLDYWSKQIQSGALTPEQVASSLQGSTEGALRSKIGDAYQQYLGREADTAGLDYWANKVNSGEASLQDVISGIAGSQESNKYREANPVNYFGSPYQTDEFGNTILDENGIPIRGTGYGFQWEMKPGETWDQATNRYYENYNNAVRSMYENILGRKASDEEIANLNKAYSYAGAPSQMDLEEIQKNLINSDEYKKRLASSGTGTWLTLNTTEQQSKTTPWGDSYTTQVPVTKGVYIPSTVASLPGAVSVLAQLNSGNDTSLINGGYNYWDTNAMLKGTYPEAFKDNGQVDAGVLAKAIEADPKKWAEMQLHAASYDLKAAQMVANAGFANSGVTNETIQTTVDRAKETANWLLKNGVSQDRVTQIYNDATANADKFVGQSIADQKSGGGGFWSGDWLGNFLEKYELPIMTSILGGAVLAPAAVGAAGLAAGSAGAAGLTGGVTGLTSTLGALANGADWKNALLTGGLTGLTAGALQGFGGAGAGGLDTGAAGSTVDQASVDAFLSGASGKLTPAELVDYANFFSSQGYNVGNLDMVSSWGQVAQDAFQHAVENGVDPMKAADIIQKGLSDTGIPGSVVDQSTVDLMLKENPEYAQFFKGQGYDVSVADQYTNISKMADKISEFIGDASTNTDINALIRDGNKLAANGIKNYVIAGNPETMTDFVPEGGPFDIKDAASKTGLSPERINQVMEVSSTIEDAAKIVSDSATQTPETTVKELYKEVLKRAPEPEGLKYWSDAIKTGAMTASQVATAILTSSEFGAQIGAGPGGEGAGPGGTGKGPGSGPGTGPSGPGTSPGSGPGAGPGGSGPGGPAEGPITEEPVTEGGGEGGTGGGTPVVVPPIVVPPVVEPPVTPPVEPPVTEPVTEPKVPTPKVPTPSLPTIPTVIPKTAGSGTGGVLQHFIPNLTADIVGGTGNFAPEAAAMSKTYSIPQLSSILDLFSGASTKRGFAEGGAVITDHQPEFYSEGGLNNRYVTGNGDGTSDDVPAMLANGEFVIPADVVSALGNGSNDSGAAVLDEFLSTIRSHKQKHDPKELPPDSLGALAYLSKAKKKAGK